MRFLSYYRKFKISGVKNMLCVECGKKEIFKDGVCVDCYRDTHSFANGPQIIDLPVCSSCNSYKYKNTWTDEILGDVLRRVIKNNFQISRELKKVDINTNCNESKQELKCKVFISGFIEDVEITEEHDLLVRLKYTVCDVCSKQYGGYYESIVQIRTDKRKLTEDELKDIEDQVFNQIEEIQRKGNRSLFVTDYGLEHGGLDFYLSDKNTGLLIVKKIQEKYGGTITQSSKNIGMKDSRQVYRNTYLIRIPDFKTYDIIKQKNDFFLIKSIHGNKTKIVNLKTDDFS